MTRARHLAVSLVVVGCALAAVLDLVAPTTPSIAAPAVVTVAVVLEDEQDPVGRRLRAELVGEDLELRVVLVENATAKGSAVGSIVGDARAAVRVQHGGGAIEIWIADYDGTLQLVEVVTGSGDELAVHAAEVLRARLLESPPPPPAPSISASPSKSTSTIPVVASVAPTASTAPTAFERASPRVATLGLEIGPSMLISPGGLGPFLDVRAGARWWVSPRLALELFALVPLTRRQVAVDEGTVDVTVTAAGAGVRVPIGDGESARPMLAGGVALSLVHMVGSARPPHTGRSVDVLGFIPWARGSYPLRLRGGLSFEPAVTLGVILPRAAVQVLDRDVALFGRPLLALDLLLTLELP